MKIEEIFKEHRKHILELAEEALERFFDKIENLTPCPICSAPRKIGWFFGGYYEEMWCCPHKPLFTESKLFPPLSEECEYKILDELIKAFTSNKEWGTSGWKSTISSTITDKKVKEDEERRV